MIGGRSGYEQFSRYRYDDDSHAAADADTWHRGRTDTGKIDPHLLAGTVIGLVTAIILAVVVAVIRLFKKHERHRREASSADILAEIMAMKDDNTKDKEDNENG